jgi:hypothetical protein
MVKELTKQTTDNGLQINAKKTEVTTNSAEIEIKLHGEAFEYVPECTCLKQPVKFWSISGRDTKRRNGMVSNKFMSLRITQVVKYWRLRKPPWHPACSRSSYTAPKNDHLTVNAKRTLQTWRKLERVMMHVVWSDRVTNAEIRNRTSMKDIVAGAHSLKWKWGGHVARMDQRR